MCCTVVPLRRPPSTRQPYSRDHILRFNLSIVPGITEFRRKSNAYCGTHKAVGHKTPTPGRVNGAQARTTCIFIYVRGQISAQIFSRSNGSESEGLCIGTADIVICDLRYRARKREREWREKTSPKPRRRHSGKPREPLAQNHESRKSLPIFIYNNYDDNYDSLLR